MLLLYLLRRRRLHLRPHLRHRLLVTLHLKHGRLPLLLLVLLTVMVGFMLRDRCSPGLREQLSRLPRCAVDVAGSDRPLTPPLQPIEEVTAHQVEVLARRLAQACAGFRVGDPCLDPLIDVIEELLDGPDCH